MQKQLRKFEQKLETMKNYQTIDGLKSLEIHANGLLYDPETWHSYEAKQCKEIKKKKLRFESAIFEVATWNDRTERFTYRTVKYYGNKSYPEYDRMITKRFPNSEIELTGGELLHTFFDL